MAADNIIICNMALSRLGITLKIDSLTPPGRSKEQIELIQCFEEVRDRVLTDAPWPFARKIVALAKTEATDDRYNYVYEYPNDCLMVRSVYPPPPSGDPQAYRLWLLTGEIPYELGVDDDDNSTIKSDVDQAYAMYTAQITNPRRFPAPFTDAFAWALAAEIALPLARTPDFAKNAAAMYERTVTGAIAKAFNEETPDPKPESEFVRVRA